MFVNILITIDWTTSIFFYKPVEMIEWIQECCVDILYSNGFKYIYCEINQSFVIFVSFSPFNSVQFNCCWCDCLKHLTIITNAHCWTEINIINRFRRNRTYTLKHSAHRNKCSHTHEHEHSRVHTQTHTSCLHLECSSSRKRTNKKGTLNGNINR